jgi:hypothetical protein
LTTSIPTQSPDMVVTALAVEKPGRNTVANATISWSRRARFSVLSIRNSRISY